MVKDWEKAPVYYKRLDVSALLQDAAIDDVEMEEATAAEGTEGDGTKKEEKEEDEEIPSVIFTYLILSLSPPGFIKTLVLSLMLYSIFLG